ncbi:hypothetical protein L873DRAFT_1828060 [Choiromyces venosus 120613-1]|uniref:Uncharacterized protein n=1 Tax=Choiromyces venosus 120613-1 TaxID=1336337 RepID=A0A3N4JPZ1_9PEZI|nr:hypothetical protein L873DRAFT_1828060 [Choiromyces venosus 120613-1]
MTNLSDGEDSQMQDSHSSTPSTPPATLSNPTENLSLHSPPVEQTPPASQQNTPLPSWASKRAQEEAESAREKIVDAKFTTRWLGDDLDEGDMWKFG